MALGYNIYTVAGDVIAREFSSTQYMTVSYQKKLPGWNQVWDTIARVAPSGFAQPLAWIKLLSSVFLLMYDGIFMFYAVFYVSLMACYVVRVVGLEVSQLLKSHPHLSMNNVRLKT